MRGESAPGRWRRVNSPGSRPSACPVPPAALRVRAARGAACAERCAPDRHERDFTPGHSIVGSGPAPDRLRQGMGTVGACTSRAWLILRRLASGGQSGRPPVGRPAGELLLDPASGQAGLCSRESPGLTGTSDPGRSVGGLGSTFPGRGPARAQVGGRCLGSGPDAGPGPRTDASDSPEQVAPSWRPDRLSARRDGQRVIPCIPSPPVLIFP